MKAIHVTRYGPPEVLTLKESPKPVPKDHEVLVKIHATTVTASDALLRGMNFSLFFKLFVQAIFGFGKPRNPIMGMACSGEIAEVGKAVTQYKVGDLVYGYGALSPTKRRFGSYAEYITYPEDWCVTRKPENLSHEEAACLPYGALLALYFLNKVNLQPGQHILIYGASGSIGTMAVQLAKNAGATITAVCSSRNFEMVRSLGADKVIDYTKDDAVSKLEQYDVVMDAVGNSKTSALKEAAKKTALKPGGKYTSIDKGTPKGIMADFEYISKLAEAGKLQTMIDKTFPLEEMAEAHRYVDAGHKRGNVAISVISES